MALFVSLFDLQQINMYLCASGKTVVLKREAAKGIVMSSDIFLAHFLGIFLWIVIVVPRYIYIFLRYYNNKDILVIIIIYIYINYSWTYKK